MRHSVFAIALALSACADESVEQVISTVLRGEIHFGDAVGPWNVEVLDQNGTPPQLVEQTVAEDGSFELDLAYRAGTFLISASNAEQYRASVYTEVELDTTNTVVLTPITHLAAVLTEEQIEAGSSITDAIGRAESLVFGHFAGLAHDEVRPLDVTTEPAVAFTDDVAAGFLLRALDTLAAVRARGVGRGSGAVSTGRLLDALSADLAADGVLDGKGEAGRALELAGQPFDQNLLRAELGRGLLEFADSERNVTAFGRTELEPLANRLASDESALFPGGAPEALDNVSPRFKRWFFERGGLVLPADRPLRGAVELVVELADDSAIETIEVTGDVDALTVAGGELIRQAIDTSRLQDGMQAVEVVARDEHGNEARLSVSFDVDNTPPSLMVPEIGRVGGSTISISGTVEDRSGVELVRAKIAESEFGRIEPSGAEFAFDVQVACGRRFVLVIEAIDRAGNLTEVRREVLCDAVPPTIALLPSSFIQESSLDAIHSAAGDRLDFVPRSGGALLFSIDASTTSPIRIEKFLNRLDDLDALGIAGSGPNIPRIRFRASEIGGQAVASPWENITVEYRYLVEGVERRRWQRLVPIGGEPRYEVPISYQSLGPELAIAPGSSIHEIEVRATDQAGLSEARRFSFSVALLSPPMLLSSCTISPVLSAYDLGQQNLSVLYGSQPESESIVGTLAYPLHLPPGSLAPLIPVHALLGSPAAVSRVTELSEDKHLANPNHPDNNRPGLNCLSSSHSELEMPGAQYLGCFLGPMPWTRSLERNELGLNDADLHTSRVEVRRSGGLVLPGTDGRHVLAPESTVDVRALMVAPRVHFGGAEYDWRTSFTVPSGYLFGPHPVRHRIDARWHEGIERPPYGSFDPPRAFVTRAYVSEVQIELGPIPIAVELEGRPDVAVGVQRTPACDAPLIHRTVAP